MKLYKCMKCSFVTKERHKNCPLCKGLVIKNDSDINTNYTPPRYINSNKEAKLMYYCYKCKNISQNEVCLHCNIKGYLTLIYHHKTIVLNYLDSLSEEFTDEEVDDILGQLTFDEKNWIYHNLASSPRLLYRRDNINASVLIFISILMALLGYEISFNYQQYLVITYFAIAFGGACLSTFFSLGILYLIDAATVEYDNIASIIAIITGVVFVLYVAINMIFTFTYDWALITGLVSSLISIIAHFIYYLILRKLT